jgi:hypothetical protein
MYDNYDNADIKSVPIRYKKGAFMKITGKRREEIGKYLIDLSKVVFAVFVVDNVLNNRIVENEIVFIIGILVSFCSFFIGLKFIPKEEEGGQK